MSNKEIAQHIGCSDVTVANYASRLGLYQRYRNEVVSKKKDEVLQYVIIHYPTTPSKIIAAKFGISSSYVRETARRHGVKKDRLRTSRKEYYKIYYAKNAVRKKENRTDYNKYLIGVAMMNDRLRKEQSRLSKSTAALLKAEQDVINYKRNLGLV